MARIDLDLDEMLEGFTRDGMKKFVKKLLMASEAEEKKLLSKMEDKNDLADLDEEMHGTPNTPEVTDDDLSEDEKPKKKGRG
jgi:hypothetical protein